ncbi:RNA polymerase sigma-70 factor, ECF subfamily [Paraburkholderia sacchari]
MSWADTAPGWMQADERDVRGMQETHGTRRAARAIAAADGMGYALSNAPVLDGGNLVAAACKPAASVVAGAELGAGAPSLRPEHTGRPLHPAEIRLKALFVDGLEGDADAYRLFLQELTRHLRGFLRRRIPQLHDDVEDLVQEILLAVHNARHTWRSDEPLTAWVHAIARYKLMDFFRSRSRRESLNDPLDDHTDLFATADDEPAQARRDIGKLLDQLPDKQRLPIVHVKLEGRSVVEAAQLTGLSESAVKVGIHRGLKALAARIRGAQ